MERWAKNVNAAKTVQQYQLQAVIQQEREAASEYISEAAPTANASVLPLSAIKRTGVPLASALQVVHVFNSRIAIVFPLNHAYIPPIKNPSYCAQSSGHACALVNIHGHP